MAEKRQTTGDRKINVAIEAPLHERIKAVADRREQRITTVVKVALEAYLKRVEA